MRHMPSSTHKVRFTGLPPSRRCLYTVKPFLLVMIDQKS
jgi:hypothetical protein